MDRTDLGPNLTSFLRSGQGEINDQFLSILDSLYDGLYITDGNALTIFINRAYQTITGLRPEDVVGRYMQDILAAGLINKSGTLRVLESNAPVTLEQTFRTGKTALISSTPHYDEQGRISMVITVVRDITELNKLQQKYQEREELHRLEKDFTRRNQRYSSKLLVNDPKTKVALARAQKVAALDTTILLLGETGVGKEQFAQMIYEHSTRFGQTFISVNCGAIPPALIESELFGYERGAFTGANREGKKGVFESADKGTVFLDEVGDLPLDMQVHLLRILQEMQVTRVGGVKAIPVDVRIIAATNRDLLEMVKAKTFREDLYYRLNVVPIQIPPLRERTGDIGPLVELFLQEMNKKYQESKYFSHTAMDAMYAYSWPGNVRELKNVVEQAVILSAQDEIHSEELPIANRNWAKVERISLDQDQIDLKAELARLEYEYIQQAYAKHGTVRAAAASLGMDSSTYVRKRQRYQELLQK